MKIFFSYLLTLQLALVHKAAGGLPLELGPHVGSAVDPTVGPGQGRDG